MKIYTPLILCCALLLFACNAPSADQQKSNAEQTLSQTRPFSHLTLPDTFTVTLNGDHPENMNILFRIISHEGKEIFKRELKAAEILDNYKKSIDLSQQETQISFIKDEFKLFLDEENFLAPAITAEEQADAQSPDHLFFNELKASGLNGFKYRIGNETKVYIAWSAKDQQVKVYYTCC